MAGGIEVGAVGKDFAGLAAVDNVTFDVEPEELFVIVGESGCGKSTLLRLIAGLEAPDRGEIRLHGELVANSSTMVPPEERGTGFVFQSYALWPHLSVRNNVAFPLEAGGMGRKAAARAVEPHLATVSLQDYADRKPEALSGGQRQRVALARCLAGGARTILMDEPLANLDPHLRATMERELLAFHRSSGATTIYITHDQREAMALADRMAVMRAGRFLQVGTPQAIYERPVSPEVAGFIGHGAVVPLRYADGIAELGGGRFPAEAAPGQPAGPARALLRPEGIEILPDATPGGLAGTVRSVFYRGGTWEAELQIADGVVLTISHGAPLHPGQPVSVRIRRAWILPE
ncbi:ABC transporter ATP-binding protein [Tropicimonas sediminicola]|uniref:Carbohydrate ABC transporter ATP-binding protein, CUT1 family n=1 Tax=Tropicimonas sediminicola TaxID=1031541 RepID=A0A239LBC3_9RHOB|nr:ABC transporter ATP-binding protein [Tropicimonas sediminicola]SNT27262.1 carbohydrate ABC transporter ATP-binding protein, CUT1 family [Tropicimonas sediminicola]